MTAIALRQLTAPFGSNTRSAEMLIAATLDTTHAWLLAHPQLQLDTETRHLLHTRLMRLQQGEPLAYLTGRVNFYGLQLQVNESVLIPRPETEMLVTLALQRNLPENARVADLGCGSGAIACALAHHRPHWRIDAIDKSDAALRITAGNAAVLGISRQVRPLYGDWWQATAGHQYQLIVSNPPYVAVGDSQIEARVHNHEPHLALYAKDQGMEAYRHIFAGMHHQVSQPPLIIEHGYNQRQQLIALAAARQLRVKQSLDDHSGIPRVLVLQ